MTNVLDKPKKGAVAVGRRLIDVEEVAARLGLFESENITERLGGLPTLSPYLTTEEAAAYLRTTTQGIYALVKRRRLQPMPGRPGRLLFTREALDRYLQARYSG